MSAPRASVSGKKRAASPDLAEAEPKKKGKVQQLDPILNLLTHTSIEAAEIALPQGRVVRLYHDETVESALNCLKQHQITSCPVYSRASPLDGDFNDTYMGVFSAAGAMYSLLKDEQRAPKDTERGDSEETRWIKLATRLASAKIVSMLNDDVHLLFRGQEQDSLAHTIKHGFLHEENDKAPVYHRMAIFRENGSISRVFSQSDVLRFIYKMAQEDPSANSGSNVSSVLRDLFALPLQSLGLINAPVQMVATDVSSLAAFRLMLQARVSSLAVVDIQGKFLAQLSEDDLKGLSFDDVATLSQPGSVAQHFVTGHGMRNRLASAMPMNATLGQALDRLNQHQLHRLFFLDTEHRPVGVMSLTDLLRAFVCMPPAVSALALSTPPRPQTSSQAPKEKTAEKVTKHRNKA